MLALQLLIIAGILLWIRFLWSRRQFYTLMLKVPGPIGLPLLGIAVETIMENRKIRWRTKYFDKYGSTIVVWLGTMPFLVTRDPNIIRDYLTSSDSIHKPNHIVDALVNYIGPGLLTLQGPQWVLRRKQFNPTFKHRVLLGHLPTINAKTKALVTLLDTFVGQGAKDVLPHLFRWSFGVATQTIMGSDLLEGECFKDMPVIEIYQRLISISTLNTLMPLTQNNIIEQLCGYRRERTEGLQVINTTIDKIIEERLKSKPEDNANTVINRAIELFRDGDLTRDDVRNEISGMIVAAFETTALTVVHTLILLAMYPDHQETVFSELKELFPSAEDCDPVTQDDLDKLVYLERAVNETLRLIPTVPILPRQMTQDLTLSNGVIIPKGITIALDIFHTHRNTEIWGPEASKFNPDNFLPAKIKERHPFAFLPFLKGKRTCIGVKQALTTTLVALARTLRNYKVTTSFRYEDLVFVDNTSMKLAKQPLLEFHGRN